MIFLLYLLILISIAFLTLFERKILSLSQMRLGPNKISLYGVIQPIMDGIKLMKKSMSLNLFSHEILFKIISILLFFSSLIFWSSIPFSCWSNKVLSVLFILVMFGLMSYGVLLIGWCSNSNYGLIGSNRSIAQAISFEVLISLLILMIFLVKMKLDLKFFNYNSFWLMIMFSLIFITSIFLETHRAPLDLSEGESELVSGFNIEFGSIFFVMIFLSEYSSILFMMLLYQTMWSNYSLTLMFIMLTVMIIRSCFPRVRYDQVMLFSWMKILPILASLWFLLLNQKF